MFEFLETDEMDLWHGTKSSYVYLAANWERLGVPRPEEALKAPKEEYDEAYKAAQDIVHGTPQTARKNSAKKAVKDAYRDYANEYLVHNHRLTDEDISALRLHRRKQRTAKPVPATIPIVIVVLAVIRQLTFQFYANSNPGKRRRAGRPRNADAFVLYWAILDHEPTHISELINRSSCTWSPLTLTFSEEDRGKRLYYVACWQINRDRLEGPKTAIDMVIIP